MAEREKQSSYLDRGLKFEEDGLRNENLASSGAEVADLGFEKLDLLAGSATADLEQSVDDRVEIDVLLIRHYESSTEKRRGKLEVSRRAPGALVRAQSMFRCFASRWGYTCGTDVVKATSGATKVVYEPLR